MARRPFVNLSPSNIISLICTTQKATRKILAGLSPPNTISLTYATQMEVWQGLPNVVVLRPAYKYLNRSLCFCAVGVCWLLDTRELWYFIFIHWDCAAWELPTLENSELVNNQRY